MNAFFNSAIYVIRVILFLIVSLLISFGVAYVIIRVDRELFAPFLLESACSLHIDHSKYICDAFTIALELIFPIVIVILDLKVIWEVKEDIIKCLRSRILPEDVVDNSSLDV